MNKKENAMPLQQIWFSLEDAPVDNVSLLLNFLESLPGALYQLIDPDTSTLNAYLESKGLPGLTIEATETAYSEAKEILLAEVASIRAFPVNGPHYNKLKAVLDLEGLSYPTLVLKINLLNALWQRVYGQATLFGNERIDFGSRLVRKPLKKILEYLNKLLKSILEGVPGAGAIEELKGIIEGYIDLEDED